MCVACVCDMFWVLWYGVWVPLFTTFVPTRIPPLSLSSPLPLSSPLQRRTRPQLDADVDLAELAEDKFCAGFS